MAQSQSSKEEIQFPHNCMPLSLPERASLLVHVGTHCRGSDMSLCDSVKFGEAYMSRAGVDDEWLLNLAHRNGLMGFVEVMMEARRPKPSDGPKDPHNARDVRAVSEWLDDARSGDKAGGE